MSQQPRLSSDQRTSVLRALALFDPAVIYLFGSFGGPMQHSDSDIDLAFLPAAPVAPLTCFHLASELAEHLGHSVDLVDLTQASTVLAKEVFLTGTPLVIYHPALHQQFEMLALSDYARLNEERQAVLVP
jgi:uncharacterized protein